MTRNSTKVSPWTEEHDAFCLKHRITPAAKLLWQWLMRSYRIGEEVEPDLSEFNEWVEKHRGKGYCRLTLKKALAQLKEHRIIQVLKEYTWKIVKIVTRPLGWLKPKKNLQNSDQNYVSQPSNAQSTENESNSSSINSIHPQNKTEILNVCAAAGIYYHPDKPAEIFNYSLEDVISAVELFKTRGKQQIYNPQGWLIDCLRWRYWETPGCLQNFTFF